MSRMKHFVLKDHIYSHLLLSKSMFSVLLCSGAYRTGMHLPEWGSLELLSVLGGNTDQQRGIRGLSKHPALQQSKALSNPWLSFASHQRLQQPLEQDTGSQKHHSFVITGKDCHTSSQSTWGATSLSQHCVADLAGNAPLKGTALETEHCTTTFHCCGTDKVPIMYH